MMVSWKNSLLGYFQPRLFIVLFLGFCAGLPYGMLIDPLNLWLAESEISRTTIGLLSGITFTYSFKAAWSPFIDRFRLPILSNLLGQRRSWLIFSQILIAFALLGMASSNPNESLGILVIFALAVGFSSATQDICIDAMRIELVDERELGEATAMYQGGWRIAFLISQVATLFIASFFDWSAAYAAAAFLMLAIALFTVKKVPEPTRVLKDYISIVNKPALWFKESYLEPFGDLSKRLKGQLFFIILLVATYRFSDIVLGPMAMPFYTETGFTKEEIAIITNAFGIMITLLGAFAGGLFIYRFNIIKTLLAGAILVCLTNLAFAVLDIIGHDLMALTVTIALDNFSQGLAGAALIAYLSSLTNQTFTATQYALLFFLATVPAKFLALGSGFIVDLVGYFNFFIYAACMGLPAILLSLYFTKKANQKIVS